jgi:iron complex outermembrane recepter protein
MLVSAGACAQDRSGADAGIVTITGARLGTLPTQIPATTHGIGAERIDATLNATDSADALKYFPSLLVRKRYIGDYDHAVLSTRASGTGNSARSLVYADGVLLSNLLGNGASFTPRWGLVTPEEVARVDVLYGPFSAAYPGNSVGAVVDYVTRMPDEFEAHAKLVGFGQQWRLYGTNDRPAGGQASAAIGSREGAWAWWFNLSRQDSESQPLVYTTRTPSAAAPAPGAVEVSGAVQELNRFNQPWLLIGTSNHARTLQDHAKLKLAFSLAPQLLASYTLGWWDNTAQRRSEGWLRDAAGNRIEITPENHAAAATRAVAIDGAGYTLSAADFGRTQERLQHLIHGLSLRRAGGGESFDWQLAASVYDYERDQVRAWAPLAGNAVAGRLTDQEGTGWNTLAAKATWRLAEHTLEWGLQRDAHRLRNKVFTISEWTAGEPTTAPSARFEGNTLLTSLWLQNSWALAPGWKLVPGLRAERWLADQGLTANGAAAFGHPVRRETGLSPKLALGWQLADNWSIKLASGRALRWPTVSELFQGGVNASTGALQNGDPNLKPEDAVTSELSAQWRRSGDSLRATVFHEAVQDALYSQTNTAVTPNVTNIQNVERIRTWGLELAAVVQDLWLQGLELNSSLTFADSEITANSRLPASVGRQQPRVPRWRANLLASWRAGDAITTTLGLRYAGRQFNTLDNSDPNGSRYQGASRFLVADARLRWQATPQWSAALGVDNLGNALYWNFHPYPGRTWVAELRFDL